MPIDLVHEFFVINSKLLGQFLNLVLLSLKAESELFRGRVRINMGLVKRGCFYTLVALANKREQRSSEPSLRV
jgi:hypothetical protein